MKRPDEFEWMKLKLLGLKPSIVSAAHYANALERGIQNATHLANGFTSGPFMDTAQISALHWVTYREIFPWAGQFRQAALTNDNPRQFSEHSAPETLRQDLRTLNVAAQGWFQSDDILQNAKEIAAYSAGLLKIQPFLHGNEVVCDTILKHQTREVFEREVNFEHDLKLYNVSLERAVAGNMTPLANQILEHAGLSRTIELRTVERRIHEAVTQLKEIDQGMYHTM